MRARLAAQMALPVLGAMGAVGAAQIPAAAATPAAAAAPRAAVCSAYGAGSLLTGITHGAGGIIRGVLGDYRKPGAASTHAVGKLGTGVSRLTDGILGRPETFCAPIVEAHAPSQVPE
jgi:hypothetical protein